MVKSFLESPSDSQNIKIIFAIKRHFLSTDQYGTFKQSTTSSPKFKRYFQFLNQTLNCISRSQSTGYYDNRLRSPHAKESFVALSLTHSLGILYFTEHNCNS